MQERVNQIDPAMAEVLKAMNMISPVTPEGTPTVAATVLNAASQMASPGITQMSPSVGQAAQQAGIAAQLEAMKMQQAQQALMNQAMNGVAGLNPNIAEFAEGGIVGYNRGGMTPQMQEMLRRRREEKEKAEESRQFLEFDQSGEIQSYAQDPEIARQMLAATTPLMPIPEVVVQDSQRQQPASRSSAAASQTAPAVRAPQGYTSAQLFDQARREIGSIATLPISPQQAIEPAIADQQAIDEYRRRMGLPSEMERISRQEEQFKRLYSDRESMIQRRLEEIEAQKGLGGIAAFLRGFQQMKGQPIGAGFVSAAESGQAYDAAMRQRRERLEDLKIEIQGLSMEKQNSLDKMRDDIANGRFKDAMVRRDAAQKADNEIRLKQAELSSKQAQVVGQQEEARIRQMQQPGELERLLGRLDTLRKTDPAAAEKLAEDIATIRGAGRKPSGSEARQRMLELYADNWEKMDLLEKNRLREQGIGTYEDYVKYRDRIAGVAPTAAPSGGASSDLLKRADAIVGGR